MPRPAKVRAHTSTAFSKAKYGSSAFSVSPAMEYDRLQGSRAASPLSFAIAARAASMMGRES